MSSEQPPVNAYLRFQSSVQAALKPGLWFPLLNRAHSYREVWDYDQQKYSLNDMLLSIEKSTEAFAEKYADKFTTWINHVDREMGRVEIFCLTRAKWLDVVLIDLVEKKLLSFFPFYDIGLNQQRVEAIREGLSIPVDVRVGSVNTAHALFW